MPYITVDQQKEMQEHGPRTAAEFNFAVTKLIQFYLSRRGVSYSACNDVLGAMEACKLEFYRRFVAPYEDLKKEANGDVWDVGPMVSKPQSTIVTP